MTLKLGTIKEELAACREACKGVKIGDLMILLHHNILCEPLTEPIENRIQFILDNKPKNQQAIRFWALRPWPGGIPIEWQRLQTAERFVAAELRRLWAEGSRLINTEPRVLQAEEERVYVKLESLQNKEQRLFMKLRQEWTKKGGRGVAIKWQQLLVKKGRLNAELQRVCAKNERLNIEWQLLLTRREHVCAEWELLWQEVLSQLLVQYRAAFPDSPFNGKTLSADWN